MAPFVLFTGYALLAAVCVIAAVAAHRAADRAVHAANALMHSRGRLIALEGSVETLDNQLRKLKGRVYATEPRAPKPPDEQEIDVNLPVEEKNRLVRERLRLQHGLPKIGAKE